MQLFCIALFLRQNSLGLGRLSSNPVEIFTANFTPTSTETSSILSC